ncbi:MAG: phosphoribosyltransferase family protein, partial [Candidatus Pacearchaeota archaeon]
GEEGEKRRRTGAPMTYTQYDQGLGTEVGRKADLYAMGNKDRNKFFRLRKWQYRISTAIERNLKLALAELKRVSSYLKLPKSVEEESARIYTLAVQRGLVRGRSMESVVAGALYAACRRHDVPRTLDELSEASGIEKKEIGRRIRLLRKNKNLDLTDKSVIIIDDGLSMGSSMEVAVKTCRNFGAKTITIVVPTASKAAVKKFEKLVEKVVCIDIRENFVAVADAYEEWHDVDWKEISKILKNSM